MPTSKHSPTNGHRTLTVLRKGGKLVTMPLAPRVAGRSICAVGERLTGRSSSTPRATIGSPRRGRIVRRIARRARISKRVGPHTLRRAFVTAALDAGVPLRDVQEAASHADPRRRMRYDRGRQSLDRHATYIVATFVAGAARLDSTPPGVRCRGTLAAPNDEAPGPDHRRTGVRNRRMGRLGRDRLTPCWAPPYRSFGRQTGALMPPRPVRRRNCRQEWTTCELTHVLLAIANAEDRHGDGSSGGEKFVLRHASVGPYVSPLGR